MNKPSWETDNKPSQSKAGASSFKKPSWEAQPAANTVAPVQQIEVPAVQSTAKTPLDSSRYNVVGSSILPRYREDTPLAAIGKDIVNYGAGTLLRGLEGLSQAGMQLVTNTDKALRSQPLDFSQKSLRKDVLPQQYDQFINSLERSGAAGQIASGFIQGGESLIKPETLVGGLGVVDDLTRMGLAGKTGTLGTTENLLSNAARGQKALKSTSVVNTVKTAEQELQDAITASNPEQYRRLQEELGAMPDAAQQATKEYLTREKNIAKNAGKQIKTPNVIYATDKGKVIDPNQLSLPAGRNEPLKPPLMLKSGTQNVLPTQATSKIELGGATSKAKQVNPAEFYVDQYGHTSTTPDVFPTNQLRLQEPGLPFEDVPLKPFVAKRNIESPNRLTPNEAKKLNLDTQKMGRPIFSGEYGKAGTSDVLNQNRPHDLAVETPNPYAQAKGRTDNINLPLQSKKALRSPEPDYTLGRGRLENINAPLAGKRTVLRETDNTLPELPTPSNSVVMENAKTRPTFKNAWDKFYTRVVDTLHPVNKFSKAANDDTATLASNSRNVGGTVDYILKEGLVDRNGNKIGSSLRNVAERIPLGREKEFWDYMSQRHNIDRAREGKNVIANYTSEMSQQATKAIEKANPTFKTVGDEITSWIDSFMQEWGVKAGTVDKTVYKELRDMYKSYFPTQREFSQLEKSMPDSVRKQFVDQLSPIRTATGSGRDINNPLENIMNLVNRTVRTARYNEVGKTLLASIRKQPEKLRQFAEVIPGNEGMFANTDNVVSVMENGKTVYLQINNKELLDALKGLPKVINNMKAMRAVTNVFKGLITQKNPLFAIRNIARDIPTAYIYGSEKNPFKFAGGLAKASRDIATNSEAFQRYRAVGGGGSNFFAGNAERAAQNLTKKGIHPLKTIETFNNLTETAPRLAEFNRVFEKTGDVQKALAAANDVTVNFARGGNLTKMAEPLVPYLNAGVQGLDKFFRGFKDPKTAIATLAKGGVSITVPTIGLYLINKDDPNYQELDNRIKDTYYCIPKGDGTFIKIPKSRELGMLFGALFERILRASSGEKEAFKGFGKSVATSFMPNNPVENNIGAPLLINLATNKDFAGRSIVPQDMVMDKRSRYLQYDEKTTVIAKAIGEFTHNLTGGEGLSPKQIDYLVKSYTGVIGQIGLPLATPGGNPLKAITNQFTADPVYSNQNITDFYDNYDKLQKVAADKNKVEKIPSRILTSAERVEGRFRKASERISKINKDIVQAQQEGNDALVRELKRQAIDIAKAANESLR